MAQFATPLPPLLFGGLESQERTPRNGQSPGRGDSTSFSRRSLTPNSATGDNTPPRPPPRERLSSLLLADGPDLSPPPAGSAAAASGQPPPTAAAAGTLPAVMPLSAAAQTQSCWVTVFGFQPSDLPLILREFQKCGDILQWGTFGSAPQSNFVHIQYQNPYSAQRALLRSNEQLSSALIVGVKQLDPMHQQLIDNQERSSDVFGPKVRAAAVAPRPYKVEAVAATALPQPTQTWTQKLVQYVLGI